MTTVTRLDGIRDGLGIKAPVKCATTANITLSGEQTIDGVSVVDGDRVLVKDQTTATENGIYVASTGSWVRAKDFDGTKDVAHGTLVYSALGNTYQASGFILSTASPVIGTSNLTFIPADEGGTAGGSTLQLQYNNAGAFAGMAGTSWDDTNRALTITGATVTGDNPIFNLTQTWNNAAVAFNGIKLNVTDNASLSTATLMNLQVGGTSQFKVSKSGTITMAGNGTAAAPAVAIGGTSNSGLYATSNRLAFTSEGSLVGYFSGGTFLLSASGGMQITNDTALLRFGSAPDIFLGRNAAASLRLGAADAASPVAQTFGVQSVVAGTTDTAGANFTIKGSAGTGTGAGGSIVFRTAPAGGSGSSQNSFADVLTLTSTAQATFTGVIYSGNLMQLNTQVNLTGASSEGLQIAGAGSGNVIKLYIDSANILALRNGATAQRFNVYNTYTDGSNFERLAFAWQSNEMVIWTDATGTGNGRPIKMYTGWGDFSLGVDNTQQWKIAGNAGGGHFLPLTNNTYDIGSSSLAVRYVHAAKAFALAAGTTVASLPSPATVGMIARVTDASSPSMGATVAGGGAAAALVWYNGSNWTVIGV